MRRTNTADERKLGWFGLAGLLVLLLSTPAWGLDFDHEVRKHDADALDVSSMLGHGRGFVQSTKSKHRHDHMRFSMKKTKRHASAKRRHAKPRPKRIAKSGRRHAHRRTHG